MTTHTQRHAQAVAHSHGLRQQLRHGLDLLHDNHELCQWDGTLLPLEPHDHAHTIRHGTDPGYQSHRRLNIPICEPCRDAHRNARRKDRAA